MNLVEQIRALTLTDAGPPQFKAYALTEKLDVAPGASRAEVPSR